MSTKIDAYQSLAGRAVAPAKTAVRSAVAVAGDSSSKAVASVPATDSVSLTGNAVELQQFEKNLGAIPNTDRGRVDRLREAVNNGSYTVDSKSVAAKLARLEYSLGSA